MRHDRIFVLLLFFFFCDWFFRRLVIVPTRELALQTQEMFEKFAREHKRKLSCFIGGTNMSSEQRSVQKDKPDVLIATPG